MVGGAAIKYYGDKGVVELPVGVELLTTNLFYNTKAIKEIVISDGLREIANGAISYCDNLRTLTIPPSVTKIDENAIFGRTRKEYVTIKCAANSYAEEFARRNGFNIELIEFNTGESK